LLTGENEEVRAEETSRLLVENTAGGLAAATFATAALYLMTLSALLGFCARYAAQASRMAKLGMRALLGMDFPVIGLVSWSRNHSSMTCRSKVCPSAVNTGSRMTSKESGHVRNSGASSSSSLSSTEPRFGEAGVGGEEVVPPPSRPPVTSEAVDVRYASSLDLVTPAPMTGEVRAKPQIGKTVDTQQLGHNRTQRKDRERDREKDNL
jgi:hypothetical protein